MSGFNSPALQVHPFDMPCVALSVIDGESDTNSEQTPLIKAIKFQGSRILHRFTGSPEELMQFAGSAPLIGHDLRLAWESLKTQGKRPDNLCWDIKELSTMLLPEINDLTLLNLARLLVDRELDCDYDVVEVIHGVYLALLDKAGQTTVSSLQRLADLSSRSSGSLGLLLSTLAEMSTNAPKGAIGGLDYEALSKRLERPRSLRSSSNTVSVDPDEVAFLLGDQGPLSRGFPGYESRPEQVTMAQAVAAALGASFVAEPEEQEHLLVEGGTGIGKSVAYLLPAILFALRNNTRVVISTNTINLQEQLITKDIPDLLGALESVPELDLSNFRYAQLKGKGNYLCLKKWEHMARGESLTKEESSVLSKTHVWMQSTATGDRAELQLQGREIAVWDRLSAGAFSRCPGARDGVCFYRHARDKAGSAHLLVVNHALLMSDLQVDGTLLPDYEHLIIDEAHNLEDVATHQLGFRLRQGAVDDLMDRLADLLQSVGSALRFAALEPERKDFIEGLSENVRVSILHARESWAQLVAALITFSIQQRVQGEESDVELRITSASRAQPDWSKIEISWDNFDQAASAVSNAMFSILQSMENISEGTLPGADEISLEVNDWVNDQLIFRMRLTGFVSQPDDATIYWLSQNSEVLSINGAPQEVGPLLQEQLFSQKRTLIFTSATLTVRGSFAHVRQRLALDEPKELALGSPFDYKRAALLCLPTDMPEPRAQSYQGVLNQVLIDLGRVAGGHTLVLFTSHSSLRATYSALKPSLAHHNIPVIAQGLDGTPQQLLSRFQKEPEMILLGTASFWEGVDIAHNALRLLVVARLPFNVPTDPLFSARSELYEQPFSQYALPQATLRFRQGFGRLIRNGADRGVAVILDGRIHTKSYGKWFLESVPPATVWRSKLTEFPKVIDSWITNPDWSP